MNKKTTTTTTTTKKKKQQPPSPPPPPSKKKKKKKKKKSNKANKLTNPGPEVINLFLCSTQLSMKFFLLINLKLLTIANSLLLNKVKHDNFSANKYENANYCWHFHIH